MEDFKARLWRLMQSKNLNNSSLGKILGKAPSTVKYWREGTWPEMATLIKIAEALEVSLEYLLFGIKGQKSYEIKESDDLHLQEPEERYGIKKDDLIEFFIWKAEKATQQAQEATKQVERLKSTEVDAN